MLLAVSAILSTYSLLVCAALMACALSLVMRAGKVQPMEREHDDN